MGKWIKHAGQGMPPIEHKTLVVVRFRDGEEAGCEVPKTVGFWHSDVPAHSNWVHEDSEADIIAYRVVPA